MKDNRRKKKNSKVGVFGKGSTSAASRGTNDGNIEKTHSRIEKRDRNMGIALPIGSTIDRNHQRDQSGTSLGRDGPKVRDK